MLMKDGPEKILGPQLDIAPREEEAGSALRSSRFSRIQSK